MITWHMGAFAAGFLLDLLLGDPYWMPHPVRLIGRLIGGLERLLYPDERWESAEAGRQGMGSRKPGEPEPELGSRKQGGPEPELEAQRLGGPESGSREPDRQRPDGPEPGAWERSLRRRGTALAAFVVLAAAAVSGTVLLAAYQAAPALGAAVEAWMTYQILALKCLKTESGKVYDRLVRGTLAEARQAVSMIVGRDTECLDEAGVIRAAVETVAENTSDGVIAPMLCLALGGPVLGFAYKAVNTMDSMIGYKNERYLDFGRTAARMDDAVNWIPARLSALLMTAAAYLLGREFDGRNAWRIWRRDRRNHASPNSAQTEAVCAGALGIRLAGDASYFGKVVKKPTIGDDGRPVEAEDIRRAHRLLYGTAWLCLGLCLAALYLAAHLA